MSFAFNIEKSEGGKYCPAGLTPSAKCYVNLLRKKGTNGVKSKKKDTDKDQDQEEEYTTLLVYQCRKTSEDYGK
jgi:hypothetical protein